MTHNADYVAPRIILDPNPCYAGWGGGCLPWGCECKFDGGHEGRHVCLHCKSWSLSPWEDTDEP